MRQARHIAQCAVKSCILACVVFLIGSSAAEVVEFLDSGLNMPHYLTEILDVKSKIIITVIT